MTPPSAGELRRWIVSRFPEVRTIEAEAWIVGGILRDAHLGRASVDVDIAARAAESIADGFARRWSSRVIPLGRDRFTSWRVVVSGRSYDFAELTRGSIEADLGRRDFTVNAMALPLHGEAERIDPFDGAGDLEHRLIRMVRRENLEDDPLRILKGVRMVAVFGFTLERETASACRSLVATLDEIAPERIAAEIETIFRQGEPSLAFTAMTEIGCAEVIFGRPLPDDYARVARGDAALALAAIFRREPEALAARGEQLRLSGGMVRAAIEVVRFDLFLDDARSAENLDVLLYDFGEETARRVVALRRAAGEDDEAHRLELRIRARAGELATLEPLLTGLEIAEMAGIGPGPRVGELKRALILAQVRGEVTTRDEARAWLAARSAS